MGLVQALQNFTPLRRVVKKAKIYQAFQNDAKEFSRQYMDSQDGFHQIDYEVLLLVHSLEKGLCNREPRFFGREKCNSLLSLLTAYEKFHLPFSEAYLMGIGILKSWKQTCDAYGWTTDCVYSEVSRFLEQHVHAAECRTVGAQEISKKNLEEFKDFDFLAAVKSRHSVREFSEEKIREEDLEYCLQAAIQAPSACNRQMCKVYRIENPTSRAFLDRTVRGSGFIGDTLSYFLITYDISAFSFSGERSQGYFNAGLFAMNFVNALHFKGIGSCFIQWPSHAKLDAQAREYVGIPQNEKIAVALVAGYYKESSMVPVSHRKPISDYYVVK